jgi:hypothetical protein
MFKGKHRHIKFCVLRQCNICASTNDTLTNQMMSTREWVQLKQWKLDHLKLVEVEWKAYHLHQQEAVADPGVTWLIIMDGSTDVILPLLVPLPLAWKDLHLYMLGIHGFINHGLHHHSLYLHQGQFSCGPNFAVSLLHHHTSLSYSCSRTMSINSLPTVQQQQPGEQEQVHAGLLPWAGVQQGVLVNHHILPACGTHPQGYQPDVLNLHDWHEE